MKLSAIVILTSTLTLCPGAIQAQQATYKGAPWPEAGRTDPSRMPGDSTNPPLSQILKPSPVKPGPVPEPVVTARLSNDLALEAAQAALGACEAQGRPVGVAITDAEGVLQLGISAEGAAPPGRIFAGVYKAVAALAFGKPTSQVRDEIRADPSRAGEIRPNMMVYGGGLPIVRRGKVVGAIGVSGGSTVQDEGCARAGLAKIADRLG